MFLPDLEGLATMERRSETTRSEIKLLNISAPGKLFLFGEYGVLGGGWCVVTAVDRRVIATRRPAATSYEILGAELANAAALPEAVLAECRRAGDDVAIGNLSADVRALFDEQSGEKLGLGSSAASTVALCAACLLGGETRLLGREKRQCARVDRAGREAIFEHAFRAHRALQNGRGSGADIASSTFGATIAYRLRRPAPAFVDLAGESAIEVAPTVVTDDAEVLSGLGLAAGLRIEPIWLGRPARSTSFVRRCEAALNERPAAMKRALGRTSAIAEEAIAALRDGAKQDGACERIVECVARADRALEELGELISAPIVTDLHRRLRDFAQSRRIAVKPSGAGGGDFSLAVGPADADWDSFLADLPAGLRRLPLRLGAEGVDLR
jgi:phosphomevalonate kinase